MPKRKGSLGRRLKLAANLYSKNSIESLAFESGALWVKENLWHSWEKERPMEKDKMVLLMKSRTDKFWWDTIKVKYISVHPDYKIISWLYLDDLLALENICWKSRT